MLWLFYPIGLLMLAFANLVILSNHPVRSVLSLIGCFLCATILWLLLEAEFLALALIFVYIGAVMTLFLFLVMMLNVDTYDADDSLSFTTCVGTIFTTTVLPITGVGLYTSPDIWNNMDMLASLPAQESDYNNVKALGMVLYTDFVWPFEIVAFILLTAIVVAVGLVLRGSKKFGKSQTISDQMAVKKSDRITLIDVKRRRV